jgi:peptide deformylase
MAVKPILLLGNPDLYRISSLITYSELTNIDSIVTDLHDTMMDFRKRYNAGRAIAAPQIGIFKRLVYMNTDSPVVFINPILTGKSKDMITLWDDCMSFPNLLVKVQRHRSCTIKYKDQNWNDRSMELSDDLSELLQHETDHLDGILAVQRAIDNKSFALK